MSGIYIFSYLLTCCIRLLLFMWLMFLLQIWQMISSSSSVPSSSLIAASESWGVDPATSLTSPRDGPSMHLSSKTCDCYVPVCHWNVLTSDNAPKQPCKYIHLCFTFNMTERATNSIFFFFQNSISQWGICRRCDSTKFFIHRVLIF